MTKQELTKDLSKSGREYECGICNDVGVVIIDRENNIGEPCQCIEIKRYKKIIDNCGIGEDFRRKSFENYKVWNEPSKRFKNMGLAYIDKNINAKSDSIAFLGQSGTGKSHITFAIASEFMKQNVPVLYMPYVDKIQELKNLNRFADENDDFHRTMTRYKTVKVLLIDDLFKGAADKYGTVNAVDIRHMFNIINERCLRHLPTIFSSEYLPNELIKIDEALGGRIIEMCGDFIGVAGKDSRANYRLR